MYIIGIYEFYFIKNNDFIAKKVFLICCNAFVSL